jgi:hypothetical protein
MQQIAVKVGWYAEACTVGIEARDPITGLKCFAPLFLGTGKGMSPKQ